MLALPCFEVQSRSIIIIIIFRLQATISFPALKSFIESGKGPCPAYFDPLKHSTGQIWHKRTVLHCHLSKVYHGYSVQLCISLAGQH